MYIDVSSLVSSQSSFVYFLASRLPPRCVYTFLFCCVHTCAFSVLFDVVVAEGLPVFLYVCLFHVVFPVFYMENGRGVVFFGVFRVVWFICKMIGG